MLDKAGIDKKISPHKLRHARATHRPDAGAERADTEAPLGHESIATPPIDTNMGRKGWRGWWKGCERRSENRNGTPISVLAIFIDQTETAPFSCFSWPRDRARSSAFISAL